MSETTNSINITRAISQITARHMGDMTMKAFGDSLGTNVSKQNVNQWLKEVYPPSITTLIAVLSSPRATGQAKSWAGDCLAVLQQDLVEKLSNEQAERGTN